MKKDTQKIMFISFFTLVVLALLFLIPFFLFLSAIISPDRDHVLSHSFSWHSFNSLWLNITYGLSLFPFGRYTFNTLVIALFVSIGTVLSCTLVAYGFARFSAKGKSLVYFLLLSTMMLPKQVTVIPLFKQFSNLGLADGILPLIIPSFFATSGAYVLLLRSYFMMFPKNLEDATRRR